jgi:AcrR family transcriptional regulator
MDIAQGVRRTQAERRDESEQRLLVAAATLIEAEGFSAVTFDRVGALAGYSRGLASQKFGSKDGLVRAVIAFIQIRLRALIDPRVAVELGPARRILVWQQAMLEEVESDPLFRSYFVMMAAAVGNRADVRDAFLAAHEDVRETLRAAIEEAQDAGEIGRSVDADSAALAIGSLTLGISVELLLDPDLDMTAMRRTAQGAVKGILGIT